MRWTSRPVVGVALIAVAVGYAQYAPAALLAEAAGHFGQRTGGDDLASVVGLSPTALGVGFAVIRVASLAAVGLAAVADRAGRRRVALVLVAVGVGLTVVAAGMPGWWWLVATLALARPALTATNTVVGVMAGEYMSPSQRSRALALVAAAYGVGSGAVVVVRFVVDRVGVPEALVGTLVSYQLVLMVAVIPVAVVLMVRRWVIEPARYSSAARGDEVSSWSEAWRSLAAKGVRSRIVVMSAVVFAAAAITGPANSMLFVFGEQVLGADVGVTTLMVVASGPVGLGGLLVGRWGADRFGRRLAAGLALVSLGVCAVVAYSGSLFALMAGFWLAVLSGSAFSVPSMALANELFVTRRRAGVAGWLAATGVVGATTGLMVVGAVADATDSFGVALGVVALPAVGAAALLATVTETRGLDLDDPNATAVTGGSAQRSAVRVEQVNDHA